MTQYCDDTVTKKKSQRSNASSRTAKRDINKELESRGLQVGRRREATYNVVVGYILSLCERSIVTDEAFEASPDDPPMDRSELPQLSAQEAEDLKTAANTIVDYVNSIKPSSFKMI